MTGRIKIAVEFQMSETGGGWAVEIEGHEFDLDEAKEALAYPSEPWLEKEKEGSSLLLRSQSWSLLDQPDDVIEDAQRLLDKINGALLLSDPSAQPLKTKSVRKLDDAGNRLPIAFIGGARVTLLAGRARGTAQVLDADGNIIKPPPPIWREWLEYSERNETVAGLLAHLVRLDNWYDVYKCVELIEMLSGGEHDHLSAIADNAGSWKRMKRMANRKRHAPSPKYPLPNPAPTFEEAKALVLKIAKERMAALC